MDITFLYYEDCPSHEQALARLRQVMAEMGVTSDIEIIRVASEAQAQQQRFIGSPTIRIDGADIVPPPADMPYSLSCRVYWLENGRPSPLPSPDVIRRAFSASV
jgi:hypothetical protein